MCDAYLDIETTGLSFQYSAITVIGVYLDDGVGTELVQLVGDDATRDNLSRIFEKVRTVYTFNGSRFDLPFIRRALGLDLSAMADHHDLMYECWRCNLRGGFKAVEQRLGIGRNLCGINGADAVMLWRQYRYSDNAAALATLLEYNKEDVINLKTLRQKLAERRAEGIEPVVPQRTV